MVVSARNMLPEVVVEAVTIVVLDGYIWTYGCAENEGIWIMCRQVRVSVDIVFGTDFVGRRVRSRAVLFCIESCCIVLYSMSTSTVLNFYRCTLETILVRQLECPPSKDDCKEW